jgi:hypothetical protein
MVMYEAATMSSYPSTTAQTPPPKHPGPPGADRALTLEHEGRGTPKGPKQPRDTTASGDALNDTGEDNQRQKH